MTAAGVGQQLDLYIGTEMNDSEANREIPGHVAALCPPPLALVIG